MNYPWFTLNTSTTNKSVSPRLVSCRSFALPLLFAILLTCSLFSLTGCSDEKINDYNYDNIKQENDCFTYSENGATISLTGVDVSDLQGEIDWKKVANNGIDFAMIRIGRRGYTEGDIYLDDYYYSNTWGATQAGLPFGVYFFSQAINEEEAQKEADFVIHHLQGSGITYPVAFDHEPVESSEGRANNLPKKELTAITKAFCDRIEQAGYTPMIYGNTYDMQRVNLSELEGIDIWYAEYQTAIPADNFKYVMWQYSCTAHVEGINTNADLSLLFRPLDSN